MDKIICNISSQAHRIDGLLRRIEELIPQCDRLNIYIENIDTINAGLWAAAKNEKVYLHIGNRGLTDEGKYFCVADSHGYYLTQDDDISYPADYTKRIVEGIEKYKRKKIVSFQGCLFKHPIESYYKSRIKHDYRFTVLEDVVCDTIGDGVSGFHTDTIKLSLKDFPEKYMADLQLSIAARKKGIDVVCLWHHSGYILPDDEYKNDAGIRKRFYNDDSIQTELARKYFNS